MASALEVSAKKINKQQVVFPLDICGPLAAFAAPVDVYQLCLTCSFFHKTKSGADTVLATQLLGTSLRIGLSALLAKRGLSTQLFDGFEQGRFYLAGSIILQAVFGEEWDSDVDCYIQENYTAFVDQARKNINAHGYRYGGSISSSHFAVRMEVKRYHQAGKEGKKLATIFDNFTDLEDEAAVEKQLAEQFGDAGGRGLWNTFILDAPARCKNSLDLVVGVPSLSTGYTSPLEMIDKFDIEMCKSRFDGTTFHIADPHLTFHRMSRCIPIETMSPNRIARKKKYEDRGFELYPNPLEMRGMEDYLVLLKMYGEGKVSID